MFTGKSKMQTNFRRTTMFMSYTKSYIFLLFCFVFSTCLTISFAEDTPITVQQQDSAEPELDFEALLAAIKKADTSIKSGEGEFVYTYGHPPFDAYTETTKGKITFDSKKTRIDLPRRTTILTPTTMWEVVGNGKTNYYFSTKPRQKIHQVGVDPRQWLTLGPPDPDPDPDYATYLKENNFQIKGREVFHDMLCYVLESKQGDKSTKIWIAPERGFRHLKHESKYPLPVDALDSDIPMEALAITRTIIFYQQFGEIWFPKRVYCESSWVDFKVEEPVFFRQTLETKNFKINHSIPTETFTVEIPDDVFIQVEGINKVLSKKEFLEQFGKQ